MTEPTPYPLWRETLDQWLTDRQPRKLTAEADDPVGRQIIALVQEARFVVEAINATAERVEVIDKNKYDHVLSLLDRLVTFDEFVLAEYTYDLWRRHRPGIRLLLENDAARHRLVLVFFEDTRFWPTDGEQRRIAYELMSFELGGGEPAARVADESAEYFQADWSWRQALREGLCLPLLLMDEDS